MDSLLKKHAENYKTWCEEYVYNCKIKSSWLGISEEKNPLELYFRMAEKRREMNSHHIYEKMPVEDITDEIDEKFPIMIEETYIPEGYEVEESKDSSFEQIDEGGKSVSGHLYILVHGLGGTAGDMKQVMNEIALINPNSRFFLSRANEGKRT